MPIRLGCARPSYVAWHTQERRAAQLLEPRISGSGTAVGAVIGGAAGLVGGILIGKWLAKKLSNADAEAPDESQPSGNSPANAPGQTAGGRATDENGNVLGPSGKPAVHETDHATRKQAKDAARNEGKGAPVNHPSPRTGDPHYHPTGPDGKKIPNSTHHNYPP